MLRRSFLTALASLPFMWWVKPKPSYPHFKFTKETYLKLRAAYAQEYKFVWSKYKPQGYLPTGIKSEWVDP